MSTGPFFDTHLNMQVLPLTGDLGLGYNALERLGYRSVVVGVCTRTGIPSVSSTRPTKAYAKDIEANPDFQSDLRSMLVEDANRHLKQKAKR